jgi:hypothetical protein
MPRTIDLPVASTVCQPRAEKALIRAALTALR